MSEVFLYVCIGEEVALAWSAVDCASGNSALVYQSSPGQSKSYRGATIPNQYCTWGCRSCACAEHGAQEVRCVYLRCSHGTLQELPACISLLAPQPTSTHLIMIAAVITLPWMHALSPQLGWSRALHRYYT